MVGRFPPSAPKVRTKPLPAGSIVTGFTQTGIYGFPQHKGHGVFEILTPPVSNDLPNGGYFQDVECVVCGSQMVTVDSEFLMIKATKEQVIQGMHEITKARNRLLAARRRYNSWIEEGRVK